MQYTYKCIQFHQTSSDKPLTLFAARATEIDTWAGIPQKTKFASEGQLVGESVGFQREENTKRVKSLLEFYQNTDNIIQNPLLCSLRTIPDSDVHFEPTGESPQDSSIQVGTLSIDVPDFSHFTIESCLRKVREYIEERVPECRTAPLDQNLLIDLRSLAAKTGYIQEQRLPILARPDGNDGDTETFETYDPTGVLFEESHIVDFWQELATREKLLQEIGQPIHGSEFLGFTKEALLSYLCPVVLVDGQHRLRGALEAAHERLSDPGIQSEVEDRIQEGESSTDIEKEILGREARLLPISLLMTTSPEEQVFQFVVVNQKATPIGRALLGTIVSTTLSNDEMNNVAYRLRNAGIEIEESQAITYMLRHQDSPFKDLVERGLTGDSKHLLQWSVFASLIAIFRNLKGGKLFGEKNDYAELWGKKYLPSSEITADYSRYGCETPIQYWMTLNGPWRSVFIRFWTKIRTVFGNSEDPDKPNYWGRPRQSNLFNKVSLTILAADFFQFLIETKTKLTSAEEIPALVDDWLENVSMGYFDKDWSLAGVKKDSIGIRSHWASIWSDYRKAGGNLPDRRLFRQAKGT